jgi:hypothetical protein
MLPNHVLPWLRVRVISPYRLSPPSSNDPDVCKFLHLHARIVRFIDACIARFIHACIARFIHACIARFIHACIARFILIYMGSNSSSCQCRGWGCVIERR